MTNADLRELYARVLDRPRRAITLARLSVERVAALVERRGGDADRLRTLDAVMQDRAGIAELEILLAAAGVRRARWSVRPFVFAAAAGLLIAVGLTPVIRSRSNDPDRLRGARATPVELIGPSERVRGAPITFSWAAVGGAREYEIEVLDADGLSAFVSTVSETSVSLPANVRLTPGREYRWWVVARRADGTRVGAVPRRLRLDTGAERGPSSSARSPLGSPRPALARAHLPVRSVTLS